MNESEQRRAAKKFVEKWIGKGDEKSDTQKFWIELLQEVYGVENINTFIIFEKKVKLDNINFIDANIPSTKVLIEQKNIKKDLHDAISQSDGSKLTPFQQAQRYVYGLPVSEHPRWIVTCNFKSFLIYDMERPNDDPQELLLENLPKEYNRLNFLVKTNDEHIQKELEVSMQAGELVGRLYNAFAAEYINPKSENTLKSLNVLCVRLVFCLYAEDADVFGGRSMFHDYLAEFDARHMRKALIDLFKVLDTPENERDPYLEKELAAFPYVNGGLFADEDIEIPNFTEEIKTLLLINGSENFDWSEISPTIFGAVFESTLNQQTRRSGGMHYTSIENIHKVIDPLFLDALRSEWDEIKNTAVKKTRLAKMEAFQNKLAGLKFLDPACGSGNFLTETYLSLRKLENEILMEKLGYQIVMGIFNNPIKVSISQFYGIEINDFAVTVAKTALWIAESQMMKQTEDIIHMNLDFLPLKTNANIIEDNALRIDWESIVPKNELKYIMGNPPFVGARLMNDKQKQDLNKIFIGWKNAGNLDYVSCWYKKAADFMRSTSIRAALVSTNSVSQGESVANLWKPLFDKGVHFDFAHRTFRWDSEAENTAHVHCVIIGFSLAPNNSNKIIFTDNRFEFVKNINGYLIDAENIFVESRTKPICNVPSIGIGNKPIDGGFYLFSKEEMKNFINKEPNSAKLFKEWYGSFEFINCKPRYCLWLGDCSPNILCKMPECLKRVEAVRQFRLNSKSSGTVKLADKPTRFHVENMPKGTYIVIPKTSSEKRRYIPIGFLNSDVLTSDALFLIPNSTLYHFGVLTSNIHMAWMRTVAGRLEMRYRYSKDIVYNNFPWPNPTDEQKNAIEKTAQAILDARALYPESSLTDLYDTKMYLYPELLKAHQENDKAVLAAYGIRYGMPEFKSETASVAMLMKMYQQLTNN